MKAMVLKEPGELVFEMREKPACGERELLVQVKACGIGEIDSKLVRNGDQNLKYPCVLGHEIAGVIAEKGKNINVYKVGQKVFVHPGLGCDQCYYCKKGLDHLCEHKERIGFNRDGGFQQYLIFTEEEICRRMVNIVNHNELNYDEICLIAPLACCVNIQDLLEIKKNESLLIVGGGRIGFLNFLLAQAFGVKKIYLIEKNKEQLELAKKMGFDGTFENEDDALKHLKETHKIAAFDVALTCKTQPESVRMAAKLVRKKGRIGCFDLSQEESLEKWNFMELYEKEIQVFNTCGCGQSHTRKAQSLLEAEKLSVDELITHKVSLENIMSGFDNIEKGIGIATIVEL